MEELKISELSNNELKLKMKLYEEEYENIKNKINSYVIRMNELDNLFINVKKELTKRNVRW